MANMMRDLKIMSIKQVDENLARPMKDIRAVCRGRGIGKFDKVRQEDCICNRPYSHIMCLNCGHLMFGRVRYGCFKHKMVTFLIDITNCPKCKAFEYMLEEFEIQGSENGNIPENKDILAIDDEEEDEDL